MKDSIVLSLIILLCTGLNSFASINIEDLGDFSSRSVILSGMKQQKQMSQEMRDLLEKKKLTPNTVCLINQIKKNNIENVIILLNAGVKPNESYSATYPIYVAAKENNFEIVKLLYDKGAKLDKGFYSELYEALKNKNLEMAQYLLDRNANINYRDSISNNSIIYLALKNNMIDLARQIAQKGAYIDRKANYLIVKKKIKLTEEEQ